jgi:hypothetical protein
LSPINGIRSTPSLFSELDKGTPMIASNDVGRVLLAFSNVFAVLSVADNSIIPFDIVAEEQVVGFAAVDNTFFMLTRRHLLRLDGDAFVAVQDTDRCFFGLSTVNAPAGPVLVTVNTCNGSLVQFTP